MAQLNFDANNVKPQANFDPIPAGEYASIIEASEMKPTKDNQGAYLELVHQVIDGEHQGRKIWARLNLQNKNQQAVDIAQSQLSSICRALNIMTPGDSQELHNKPMTIKVKIRAQQGYEPTNEISGWSAMAGAPAPAPAATVAPTAQPAPVAQPVTAQPAPAPMPATSAPVATVVPTQVESGPAKKPWEK